MLVENSVEAWNLRYFSKHVRALGNADARHADSAAFIALEWPNKTIGRRGR